MTIYFGSHFNYHFQVCNFTRLETINIWITRNLNLTNKQQQHRHCYCCINTKPLPESWEGGFKIKIQYCNQQERFVVSSVYPNFMFKPLSISSTDRSFTELYCLIQNFSRASKTNRHQFLTVSIGRATMSLCSWPGILK